MTVEISGMLIVHHWNSKHAMSSVSFILISLFWMSLRIAYERIAEEFKTPNGKSLSDALLQSQVLQLTLKS